MDTAVHPNPTSSDRNIFNHIKIYYKISLVYFLDTILEFFLAMAAIILKTKSKFRSKKRRIKTSTVTPPDFKMADAAEADFPSYSAEETKDGFVKLKLMIDNLKVKSKGILGFMKGSTPKGKNARIDDPIFTERGCVINVQGDPNGSMRGTRYCLKFIQLPFDIVPQDCYIKGEDGWIYVWLKKENPDCSWESNIRAGRLETADKAALQADKSPS